MIAMGQSREVENSENRYYTSSNTSRIEPFFNTDIRLTIGMAVDELSNLGEGDNTLKDLKIYYHIKEENNTKILESRGQFSYVEYDTNAVVTTFCADVSATEVDDLYTSCSDFNIPLIVYSIDKLLKYFLYHFGLCQTKFKCLKIIFVNDSNNSEEYASTEKLNEDFCEIVLNLHSMKYLEECLGAFVHEFGHFLVFFCSANENEDHGDIFYAVTLATASIANYHIHAIYKDLDYTAKYRICVNSTGRPIVQSLNCYHGVAALGEAFNDKSLQHAGQVMLAMELLSVREYWQVRQHNRDHFPPIIQDTGVCGQIAEDSFYVYTLDWPCDPNRFPMRHACLVGIQIIPITSVSKYWVDKEWANSIKHSCTSAVHPEQESSYSIADHNERSRTLSTGWAAFCLAAMAPLDSTHQTEAANYVRDKRPQQLVGGTGAASTLLFIYAST